MRNKLNSRYIRTFVEQCTLAWHGFHGRRITRCAGFSHRTFNADCFLNEALTVIGCIKKALPAVLIILVDSPIMEDSQLIEIQEKSKFAAHRKLRMLCESGRLALINQGKGKLWEVVE